MRHVRRRVVMAFGVLVLAAAATSAWAEPNGARRGHAQADRAVKYRVVQIGGRLVREPINAEPRFLSEARAAQNSGRPQRRTASPRGATRATAQPRQTRQPQPRPVRTAQQAVQTKPAKPRVERANLATPVPLERPHFGGYRASTLVDEARRYLGTNPTGRARLWCARFVNFVLAKVGQPGTGSDAAKSFAMYGRRISKPQYGAIAVLTRKGGGHVGIVTGVDRHGNPILIAGNNGRRKVGISVYPKRRVIAYVVPDGRAPATPKRTRSARAKNKHYASASR